MVFKCLQILILCLFLHFIEVSQAHFCLVKHYFLQLILIIELNSTIHWL